MANITYTPKYDDFFDMCAHCIMVTAIRVVSICCPLCHTQEPPSLLILQLTVHTLILQV